MYPIQNKPTIVKTENAKLIDDPTIISQNFTFCGTDNGITKMTESMPVTIEKYVYHLKLHNRYAALDIDEAPFAQNDEAFQVLPDTTIVTAEDIDFGSQQMQYRNDLIRKKRGNAMLEEAERKLSERSLEAANTSEKIVNDYIFMQENRQTMRDFYDTARSSKRRIRQEYLMKKAKERLCSRERKAMNPKATHDRKKKQKATNPKHLVMMIGDRGFGVGSRIKKHLRYGGTWKQDLHAKYTTVCITSENNTSQTCVYCFKKLSHSKRRVVKENKVIYKEVKGSFVCYNPHCPSLKNGCNTSSRDKVSAMAIAISGISTLLLQDTLPCFKTNFSPSNTEFITKQQAFCTRSAVLAGRGAPSSNKVSRSVALIV